MVGSGYGLEPWRHGSRWTVTDCAMRSCVGDFSTPVLERYAFIHKSQERVAVQALVPKRPLTRSVLLIGIPGCEASGVLIGPAIQVARYELAALVHPDHPRIADPHADPVQRCHDILAAVAVKRGQHRHMALDGTTTGRARRFRPVASWL